jgi:hypothetical protein
MDEKFNARRLPVGRLSEGVHECTTHTIYLFNLYLPLTESVVRHSSNIISACVRPLIYARTSHFGSCSRPTKSWQPEKMKRGLFGWDAFVEVGARWILVCSLCSPLSSDLCRRPS